MIAEHISLEYLPRILSNEPLLEHFLHTCRKEVPFVKDDIVVYKEIHKTVAFLKRTKFEY